MARVYRVPLLPEPQPEGGYAVTSPAPTGLVTGDDSLQPSAGERRLRSARHAGAVRGHRAANPEQLAGRSPPPRSGLSRRRPTSSST